MAGSSVTIKGDRELSDLLRALPASIFDDAKNAFLRVAAGAHKKISDRVQNGSPLFRRSGNLSRSLGFSVTGSKIEDLSASVYSRNSVSGKPVVYAAIHEIGGTIKASRAYARVPGGPYLNIPLPANKTASGVMRLSAREVFASGGKIVKSKRGNYVVLAGASMKSVPMFVLKKSVNIKARLGMRDTVTGETATLITDLNSLLTRTLRNG